MIDEKMIGELPVVGHVKYDDSAKPEIRRAYVRYSGPDGEVSGVKAFVARIESGDKVFYLSEKGRGVVEVPRVSITLFSPYR
ncbi:hypothetical protein HYV80_07525 [Candidatus Woesearchaeota archaeon]|nr:hypothetical protein [Candidatus Woesearchaeota archaeon]